MLSHISCAANLNGGSVESLERAKRARCEGKLSMKSEEKFVKRSELKPLQARNTNIPAPIYSPIPCYPRIQKDGPSETGSHRTSEKPISLTFSTIGGWKEWTSSSSSEQKFPAQTCVEAYKNKNVQCENTNPVKDDIYKNEHVEESSIDNLGSAKETMCSLKHCHPHGYPPGKGGCPCVYITTSLHEKCLPSFFINLFQGKMLCSTKDLQYPPKCHAEGYNGCMSKNEGPLQYENEGVLLLLPLY
jgi:hypothetical protein